jgi:uncharacterized protein
VLIRITSALDDARLVKIVEDALTVIGTKSTLQALGMRWPLPDEAGRSLLATMPAHPDKAARVAARSTFQAINDQPDRAETILRSVSSSTLRSWRVDTLTDMHPLIETHRAELLDLARKRGVVGVRVFGSMSRDDAKDDSDVDLLVTLAPGTSALALGGLLLDAQDLLGRRVDIVTEASLHPALRERVVSAAVPL